MDGWMDEQKKLTNKWIDKGVHVWKASICRPQEYTDFIIIFLHSENLNILNK